MFCLTACAVTASCTCSSPSSLPPVRRGYGLGLGLGRRRRSGRVQQVRAGPDDGGDKGDGGAGWSALGVLLSDCHGDRSALGARHLYAIGADEPGPVEDRSSSAMRYVVGVGAEQSHQTHGGVVGGLSEP